MNFTATTYIDKPYYGASFNYKVGKEEKIYNLLFENSELRDFKIDETKYIVLQLTLERVVNNIRHLASNVYPEHYQQFQKQLQIVQDIKMSYKPGTPARILMNKISEYSETFFKLTPPKGSRYYKTIKSHITSLIIYCETN